MKTNNIFKALAFLAAAFIFAACDDKDSTTVEPVFPDLVENYAVEPGSTQELVFTPNLDWTLSIPSELRQWFWINDGTFKVTELTGKASSEPVKVTIGVTENAEFDKNYSCDVTLEMGEVSQVIAKYMLPAKNKSLQVYAAKTAAEGGFEMEADGVTYVYANEEATNLNLIWCETDAEFRLPVKVIANCEWTVDIPEWADVNVPESTTGIVEIVFTGESLKGASEKIVFKSNESELLEVTISVPACGDFEVYSPVMNGLEFEYGEDGGYMWSDKPVEEVSLVWLGSDYRMPIMVDSKCNWNVELPEWLTVELPERTAGKTTLTLLGEPSKYPLEDAVGEIVFKLGDDVVGKCKVNFPGCKDILTFSLDMGLTALEYNHLGDYKTSTGYVEGSATGSLTGSKGVRIFAVETSGNVVGLENPNWFKIEVAAWNTASGATVLQERTITFTIEPNKEDRKSAVVFILPPSMDAEYTALFNEDATVKEEYVQYSIMVTQASEAEMQYIQIDKSEDSEHPCHFVAADQDKVAELTSIFGPTEYVYVLTYESPYSRDNAYMSMLSEFASYKIFSQDDTTTDKSGVEDFWLTFSNGITENKSGIVDMYLNMDLPTRSSVGYVVFYGANESVLAIVECVSPYIEEELTVDVTSIAVLPIASTEKINVISNVAWTASSNAEWCKVSPENGNQSGEISVSVLENDTMNERIAEVTIKSETLTRVVTIKQEFGQVLEVDVEEISFDCLGATAKVKITSNLSWIVTSSESWCTVSPESGKTSAEVTVSVNTNDGLSDREAVLTVSAENVTKTIRVKQKYDDGSVTNGDETVHFLDWESARANGAILQRLTEGELYKAYSNGDIPVYHLQYTKIDKPVRIVLPSYIRTHNVNPYNYSRNLRVNDTIYDEYFGPNDILSEVVLDSDKSVEINMYLPDGEDSVRGNINFNNTAGDLKIILICTLDPSAN